MANTCATLPLHTKQAVIVVGSGLAGLSAALQLVLNNVPVVMLDRAEKPGGNSMKASSGINGAPTRFQPCREDHEFLSDSIKSAGSVFASATAESRRLREKLLETLVQSSPNAIYWLSDEKGIDLSKVCQLGGHSLPRTHRGAGQKPPGAAIITTLLASLDGNPFFELRTSAKVTSVLREAREVVGVEYVKVNHSHSSEEKQELHGPVVFATGGFAGDVNGMIAKYRPDLTGLPSTNDAREGSQPLLEAAGATLVDMDQVQVHPTGFVDEKNTGATVKFLAAEALRGEGGILVLANGSRFVNELKTREQVTEAIMQSAPRMDDSDGLRQWDVSLLLDEGAAAALSSHMQFYLWKGLMRKTTVGDLGSTVAETVQGYSDVVARRKNDQFGRTSFGNWTLTEVKPDSVMYIGNVTPVLHFTMGGVVFNEQSEVLDASGAPIPGLWAAGEVTGGLHGQNRLGGSSLLECAVFGRIAGNQAATFYQQHYIGSTSH